MSARATPCKITRARINLFDRLGSCAVATPIMPAPSTPRTPSITIPKRTATINVMVTT